MISLVCPFYNEAESVGFFFGRVLPIMDKLGEPFEIVCVNDGSSDETLFALRSIQRNRPGIRIIDLSRNFGKEAALSAGIDFAAGNAVVVIDADLQDPPEVIPELIRHWRAGSEVVLAHRTDRSSDSFFKQLTARWFYRFINHISDNPIPQDVGDFRLMDRRVVDALKLLPERRRFMKGLFAWVGFRTTSVDYVREPRVAGTGKFAGWRLWNFALEGITAFSTVPLRIWTYLGTIIATVAFFYGVAIIVRTLMLGSDVPGYASLLTVSLFLGGVQLIGLGVIGEYVGRIYMESKQRPIYIVREVFAEDVKQ
jgi:glycosyltransferase involved in cell wall biosynthesis